MTDKRSQCKKQEYGPAVDEFVIRKGITWLRTTKKGKTEESMFLDFSLQIVGELKDVDCPTFLQWVLHLTPDEKTLGEEERYILIDHKSLATANHFMAAIKEGGYPKAGHGKNFNKQHLAVYFNHLKENYDSSGESKIFYRAKCLGYHNNVWVLSNENQFEGKRKLHKGQFKMIYAPYNVDYATTSLDLNEFLLTDINFLKDSLLRYYQLSRDAFTVNKDSFILATSFVLRHILTIMQGPSQGAGESKYCFLSSSHKSCGKSTAQELLLYGQGCRQEKRKVNPFYLGGGNMRSSGISIGSLKEILTATNLVVFVDDVATLTESAAENLLQLHNGFAQGSKETGLFVPEAVIMFSSNEDIPERLEGRIIVIPFQKYETKTIQSSYEALEKCLKPFILERKGLFIAWGMIYFELWKEIKTELVEKFEVVFQMLMPNEQPRVLKTWASLCSVQTLFLTTCQANIDVESMVSNVLKIKQIGDTQNEAFLQEMLRNLESAIKQTITEDGKASAKQWLNPACSFSFKGIKYPSIAVKVTQSSKPGPFKTVRFTYLKHQIGHRFGKVTTYNNVSFDGTSSRAYKIPNCLLSEEFLDFINSELSTLKEANSGEEDQEVFQSEEPNELMEKANEETMEDNFFDFQEFNLLFIYVRDIKKIYQDFMKGLEQELTDNERKVIGTPFHNKLTPNTKRNFMTMSSDEKSAFRKGYSSCHKNLFGNTEKSYVIEMNNPLGMKVEVSLKNEDETVSFSMEPKAVLRRNMKFRAGELCFCSAITINSKEKVLIEGQEVVEIHPERSSQLFKLKITGVTESPKLTSS